MTVAGPMFEPPPIVCTGRLRDVLERMTDAELALQPGEMANQERECPQGGPWWAFMI